MKITKIVYVLLLSGLCSMTVTTGVFGQDSTEFTSAKNDRIDSLNRSYDAEELEAQKLKQDEQNLSILKSKKEDTKERSKEARRVEREAYEASRESSNAYRSERRAQKARKQADKQAEKAARARKISNAN